MNPILLIAIDHRGRGGALIVASYQYRIPRCQHLKTNGTQCGSPALRNGEYCYFHRRWRMTSVDLTQSVHHVTPMFDLPVLEDADSIQITLGQIMRMIVCRQVDSKSAGLLLYALQIASANLRRTHFEPCFKQHVTVDLLRVPDRVIGDDAWSASDFANAARTPSSSEESCVARTLLSANESLPEKKPSAPELPSSASEPSPTSSLPSDAQHRELQKAQRAMTGALKGDWRDLKTLFEFTGIYPAKDRALTEDS
jgi:hypothetical protein